MSKYYLAYGSNLNRAQMAIRCPDAKPVCAWIMQGYRLVFRRGVATIEPMEGSTVPCGIWEISRMDERNLDIYEGFPHLYTKQDFPVMVPDPEELTGKLVTAMAYIMTPGFRVQPPGKGYLMTIRDGYADFGLDGRILMEAYLDSFTAE